MMRKIAVVNQKGGCGKTTTAVNVSNFIALGGKRVLLVDLDPQGHAALGFGFETDQMETSIYEVLMGEIAAGASVQSLRANLDGILSDVLLSAFEQVMAGIPEREYRLKLALKEIEDSYDYLIIDSPPNLGLLTYNGLLASKEVIIPVDSSSFSLYGLGRLLDTIRMIEEKEKHQVSVKILAANIDRRTKFSRSVVETLRTRFPDNCFETIVKTCTRLREAAGRGKPIAEYDRRCAAFHDYSDLSGEIIDQEVDFESCFTPLTFQRLNLAELLPQQPAFVTANRENSLLEDEGRTVEFTMDAPANADVQIAGDFTSWQLETLDLETLQGKKLWRKVFYIKPGSYQYKYMIDGQWIPDPNNGRTVSDNYGGANSLIEV
jgi:chromosome partitioning protein